MLNGTLKMFTRLINWIGVEIGFKGDIKHMTKNCSPNLRILTMHFLKFNLQLKKDFKKKFFRVGWINRGITACHGCTFRETKCHNANASRHVKVKVLNQRSSQQCLWG